MIALGWSVFALWLAAGPAAPAAPPAPAAPAPRPVVVTPLPVALEREARDLERMLIAPCCWMQPVSEHQSQASEDVKLQIRAWLQAGLTRQQVLDAFVARYGARILAEPPNSGFSRLLYVTPVVVFGVSGLGLAVFVKRLTSARRTAARGAGDGSPHPPDPAEPSAQLTPSSATDEARLDEELRDMD